MKIVQLTSENVKRIKAVSITPSEDVVVISGKNGQGKTSVLDSIWYALGGSRASSGTRVVRDGQGTAEVSLDLGDLIVTRVWEGEKSKLSVESKDGARYSSPQAMLDKLVGDLSFDPLEFTRQDAKKQVRTLLDLVDLEFDPEKLDAQRRGLFERRTEVNREVTRLQAALRVTPAPENPLTPDEEVSAAEVLEAIRNAEGWQRRANELEMLELSAKADIEELEKRIENRRKQLADCVLARSDLPDPLPDPAVYAQQLEELEATNRDVRAKKARNAALLELNEVEQQSEQLTQDIAGLDEYRRQALEKATMPVAGLSFTDEGVTYNDVPFGQASGAEQLRVSVAMAMALNPELRVIRVTDGSLLDSDNMQLLRDMCAEHDYQVWIEKVTDGEGVGVVISDGEVAS